MGKRFESQKIVEAFGGADAVVEAAGAALDDAQYAWAAHARVVRAGRGRGKRRRACRQGAGVPQDGQVTFATNTRHYYLTKALELEGKLDIPTSIPFNASKLPVAKRTLLLDILRTSLDYELAQGVEKSLNVTFTDEGLTNGLAVGNCVAQVVEGGVDAPDVELKMAYPTACAVIAGTLKLDDAIAAGDVEVVGDQAELTSLRELFERKL